MSLIISKQRTIYYYSAYGLKIESEFDLSALMASPKQKNVDVNIVKGAVKVQGYPIRKGFLVRELTPDGIVFSIKDVVNILVQGGSSVVVEPLTRDEEKWKNFIYGSTMAAILNQRGKFVFHASAINHQANKAVLFLGESGCGKSSLAMSFSNTSANLISDDIVALDSTEKNICRLNLGTIKSKIYIDYLQALGNKRLQPIKEEFDKKVRKFPNNIAKEGLFEIKRLIFLQINEKQNDEILFEELDTLQTSALLKQNIYKFSFVEDLNREKDYFEYIIDLSKKIPAYLLTRKYKTFDISEMKPKVESILLN